MKPNLFKSDKAWRPRMSDEDRARRETLEKRVFWSLDHATQRRYTRRVEEVDGPPPESWKEINAYCGTHASSLQEWVAEMSERRFGRPSTCRRCIQWHGSIPFEAAELGCDVYASDLNPVACLLTWGALNLIAGPKKFHAQVLAAQDEIYREMDAWYLKEGLETSAEGWRATLHFYCVEITVPEWDGWRIPILGSLQILKSAAGIWLELIPVESEKRFDFKSPRRRQRLRRCRQGHEGRPGHRLPPTALGYFSSPKENGQQDAHDQARHAHRKARWIAPLGEKQTLLRALMTSMANASTASGG